MRRARERSESGVYHVVLRGINRQGIFCDDDDYQRFKETVHHLKAEGQFAVYCYCLMTNHVHLIIKEQTDGISRIMSRIGTSYAGWYNRKYGRSGHVFQGRYGSECIENDTYLLVAARYVHNNPVKAGMVVEPDDYRWSSLRAYYGETEHPRGLSEPEFILGIIHKDRSKALAGFKKYMEKDNTAQCLEDVEKRRLTDSEVKTRIERLMTGAPIGELQRMEPGKRNDILREIKTIDGVSLRQIARVTGLSVNMVFKS